MLLNVNDVCYGYDTGREILHKVNLSIYSNEIVGISAPSGYGKTTLARIIGGYIRPWSGEVTIDHAPIKHKGYAPVQLIFQHPEKAVNPRWKMRRVLEEVGGVNEELLQRAGIQKEWLNRFPIELSGGELQRFCIVRVLNGRTKFLIADEMTTMFDAITQAQLWRVVMEYARENEVGILAISHEKDLLARICDRVVTLDSGNETESGELACDL